VVVEQEMLSLSLVQRMLELSNIQVLFQNRQQRQKDLFQIILHKKQVDLEKINSLMSLDMAVMLMKSH
jgi:hypothetical protein